MVSGRALRLGLRVGIVFIACGATAWVRAAEALQVGPAAGPALARFAEWQARFSAADPARRGSLTAEGLGLTQARREALRQFIRENPEQALACALTTRVRNELPAAFAGLLEERVRGVATIRVQQGATAGVSADGLARTVTLADGRVLAAHVYGERLVDQDVVGVPVHGIVIGDTMAVAESPVQFLEVEDVPAAQRQPGRLAAAVGADIRQFDSAAERDRFELEQRHPLGLPVPTAEDSRDTGEQPRVRAIRLNALGLQRLNQRRQAQGQAPLSEREARPVPVGEELDVAAPGAAPDKTATADSTPAASGPAAVDNSALLAFPPIRSQGAQGSCAAFSTTYYQMTHMTAFARGWDAKNGGDAFRFSPKWTYNMVNGGGDNGSWESQSLDLGRDHGLATWAEFPYTGAGTDVTAWCLEPEVWRAAIARRMNAYGIIGELYTDAGLDNLKAALDNGYVATFDSYAPWSYRGWVQATVANDPATGDDDAFVGQQVCAYVRALDWGHAMTIVGYNDHIWCDLNGNGEVDAGEKGALKIANSWGYWANAGYAWFAYDALRTTSAVPGWDPADKVYGLGYADSAGNCRAFVTTAKTAYAPALLARFTIRHALRNQVIMRLGRDASGTATSPSVAWVPYGLSSDGGALAFDGTTTACDGTFYLDLTSVTPDLQQLQRYFVGMTDSSSAGAGQLLSYALIDTANARETTVTPTAQPDAFSPATGVADAATAWGWIDYTATASPLLALSTAIAVESIAPANGLVDPDETVTLNVTLSNLGSVGTVDLVATLLPGTGLSGISGPQTYGVIPANGAVTRPFSVTASGANGDTISVVFQLQDGSTDRGTLSQSFVLGPDLTPANSSTVAIPDNGSAALYPTQIVVQGLPANPSRVTVSLHGLTHTYPDDLDVLLVGPQGQAVLLMSDAGGGYDLSDVTLTFDDTATSALPDSTQIVAGTFRPTDIGVGDQFAAPAPTDPYGTELAAFAGLDPNGTWSLYVTDDNAGNEGGLADGWSLAFAYDSDEDPPAPAAVALTAPADGASYVAPASVSLAADVTANGHSIDTVRFYSGTTLLGEDSSSPYECTWSNVGAGSYTLAATVTYDGSLTAESALVLISVSGLEAPWQTCDVGTAAAGSAEQTGTVYTLRGAGTIAGTADSFRWIYQPLTGDGSIIARVVVVENTGTGADAGVMIRETLTPGSRHATLAWRPDGQFEFQRRTATGGTTASTLSPGYGSASAWVRLVRAGSKITAYKSADTRKWTSIGSASIKMASSVWIGLAVASGDTQVLNTSTFDGVTVVP